jgi:MFS transporter, DHA1 family, inner membrane transport protein
MLLCTIPEAAAPERFAVPLPILALAVASFGIGTTEFVIMGLLPEVARSFGVTIPQAGYLVSGYALGVVVGAPIVAILTAGLPRKTALLALMGVFLAGNLGCALAPTYGLLMAARILTAFAHGAFFGIGAVVARDLVPRDKRTQAVSLMFAGLTLASRRPWRSSSACPPVSPGRAGGSSANSVPSAAGPCCDRC